MIIILVPIINDTCILNVMSVIDIYLINYATRSRQYLTIYELYSRIGPVYQPNDKQIYVLVYLYSEYSDAQIYVYIYHIYILYNIYHYQYEIPTYLDILAYIIHKATSRQ